ncbi:hypothetical protein ACWF82_20670 [Nocardia sp. NPDC055053]
MTVHRDHPTIHPTFGHTMFEHSPPHDSEPDIVIQIHWTDIQGECWDLFYEACTSAARRFTAAFNATHTNANAILRASTVALSLPRLPCERNWVIP